MNAALEATLTPDTSKRVRRNLAVYYCSLGSLLTIMGELEEARDSLARGLETLQQTAGPTDLSPAHAQQARRLLRMGDFEGSIAHSREAIRTADLIGDPLRMAQGRVQLAETWMALGRLAEADQELTAARDLHTGLRLWSGQVYVWGRSGDLAWLQERFAEASAFYEHARWCCDRCRGAAVDAAGCGRVGSGSNPDRPDPSNAMMPSEAEMSVAHALPLTPQDALSAEDSTGLKHEFVDGELWAMPGGTPEHNLIASNTTGHLFLALRGRPCRVYNPDQLVHVHDDKDNATLYPDVSVYCHGAERSETLPRAFTNPLVLVEVLSDSTEAYDRTRKFALYRKLASLRHYVLLAQDRVHAEVYDRNDDGTWTVRFIGPGGVLPLSSIEVELQVDDLYDGVFKVTPDTPAPDEANA